jgi:hypothetical protein
MDRIQRRQIRSCLLLCPAQIWFPQILHSDSVRIGGGERGKRHEFNVGDFHGTTTGNLFLLLHGSSAISNFIISCLFRSWYLFERRSNRVKFGRRVYNTADGKMSTMTVQSTVNLKSGDQVSVRIFYLTSGTHLDEYRTEHLTHFTGWMLQEDIVASL